MKMCNPQPQPHPLRLYALKFCPAPLKVSLKFCPPPLNFLALKVMPPICYALLPPVVIDHYLNEEKNNLIRVSIYYIRQLIKVKGKAGSQRNTLYSESSLVDGGGLRTFLCDPMHTFRSSGYTLSGIYIFSVIYTIPHTNLWVSAGVHTLAKKSCFSSLFGSHPPDQSTFFRL